MSYSTILKAMVKDYKKQLKIKDNDKIIDERAEEIRNYTWEIKEKVSVDIIIEALTEIGQAPSILYDDNGHFAVCSDGTQNLLHDADLTKETTFAGTWWIPPNGWKKTIRQALYLYLKERD